MNIYVLYERQTYLDDIQAGSSGAAHVNRDRFDQRALGKVLDLLGHRSAEKQRLPLSLKKDIKH